MAAPRAHLTPAAEDVLAALSLGPMYAAHLCDLADIGSRKTLEVYICRLRKAGHAIETLRRRRGDGRGCRYVLREAGQ